MMLCAGSSITLCTIDVSLRTYGDQPSSRAESNYARKRMHIQRLQVGEVSRGKLT